MSIAFSNISFPHWSLEIISPEKDFKHSCDWENFHFRMTLGVTCRIVKLSSEAIQEAIA